MSRQIDSANRYASAYLDDYGFEAELVRARQKLLAELFQTTLPKTVVEIGCGSESLVCALLEQMGGLSKWIIVEPAAAFAAAAVPIL